MSFTAKKGEVTYLIGINGVGKTTLLKAIMGLMPINTGRVLINGAPLSKELYETIHFIPDVLNYPPRMSIAEAMQFMQDFYSVWNGERAHELLDFFKLKASDRIRDLSKGNMAKAKLLLSLSLDIEYILMDEPFSGIDLFSREQISELFTTDLVVERGILITTHEIQDIEHLIDKAVLLDHGRIIRDFYPEDMRESLGKSVVDVMREVYNQ